MAKDRRRGRGKKFRKQQQQQHQSYEDIIKENKAFETYYKAQNIVAEDDWETFMNIMREHLPVSFRITGSKSHAKALLNIIQSEYFSQLLQSSEDPDNEVKPVCLSWYPDELAWQVNLSRKCIRKSEAYTKLHNFLIYETNGGYISRQETVSMIPPLLLDIQPHHKVLDMCAAPGSKTAQLIEMLHAKDDGIPEGLVVANDVDNKRCYMLVHQAKRLHSPCFVITNHDASAMPNIKVKKENGDYMNLKYDRILCDVPCSGDGTLRKNYDVWQKWNTANGNNFHGIQSRIARRGLELLEVGGLMAYSTCSLNPMEDEAVIHRILVECEGSVELVDVSSNLPGLKYHPGLSSWVVMNRDLVAFSEFDKVPEKLTTQIRPTMFPPNADDAEKFHLDRCMRILPHYQNTGGFFVAILKKVSSLPWEKNASNSQSTSVDTENGEQKERESERSASPPRKKRKFQGFKEDPFFFFTETETIWPPIKEFYGIDDSFDSTCLLTRCDTGKKRNVYLVSKAVKEIVIENTDAIKIVNTGVKVFSRNENKGATCGFRLTQEGIDAMLPFIHKRHVHVQENDLILLLTTEFPFNTKMSQETKSQLQSLDSGCLVLIYTMTQPNSETPLTLVLCGWKGATSIRAYIPKSEQIHYLRLIGVDTSKYERNRHKSSDANDESKKDSGDDASVHETAEKEDEVLPEDPEELENAGDAEMVDKSSSESETRVEVTLAEVIDAALRKDDVKTKNK